MIPPGDAVQPPEPLVRGRIDLPPPIMRPSTMLPAGPTRRAYTREEIIAEARAYMVRTFGKPNEAADKDAWHTRFGLLVDFLSERFPPQDGAT